MINFGKIIHSEIMGESKKEKATGKGKTAGASSNVSEEPEINELKKQVFNKIDTLSNKVNTNANTCEENFKSNEFAMGQFTDKLKILVEEMDKMKLEIHDLKSENAQLKSTVENLTVKVEIHDHKFETTEIEKKKANLCIDGVVEREGLSLLKVVNDLFRDLDVNLKAEEVCQSIYRKGTKLDQDGAKPRPIIVCFHDANVKGQIFKNLSKLAGNPTWLNVYVNDDYTPEQIGKIKDLRAINGYARSLGKESKMRGVTLFVDGKKFSIDEVDKVPEEIKIEKAKTIKIDDGKGYVFQGHHSYLSNMSESKFVYEGSEYHFAETAYQVKNAEESGHHDTAMRIRLHAKKDPYGAKRMTKYVKEKK